MPLLLDKSDELMSQIAVALTRGKGKEGLKRLQCEMIAHLRTDFQTEFALLGEGDGKDREIALKEYVKARTSHLARDDGWEDVAILHKREGEGATSEERQKYTVVANMVYALWGLGSHEDMEKTGQIYGPCVTDLVPKDWGGGHKWAVNAAWLLGHLHSSHRLIQVVPITKDNLIRGSVKDELGALYYEVKLAERAGMRGGREGTGVWKEWIPNRWSRFTSMSELKRENVPMKPNQVAKLQPNISLEKVVEATKNAVWQEEKHKNAHIPKYEPKIIWVDGAKVSTFKYAK